jgi:putative sporulation protein YtaF
MFYNILLFSLALSLDAYGVGITLGLRSIKISGFSRFIIGTVSFIFTAAGMFFGTLILSYVPSSVSKYISSCMIFSIGFIMLIQGFRKCESGKTSNQNSIKNTASILSQPEKSDMDDSKSIDAKEAIYLATAISADSFFSSAALNFGGIKAVYLPLILAVSQIASISLGQFTGRKIRNVFNFDSKKWAVLSGAVIMAAAIVFLI